MTFKDESEVIKLLKANIKPPSWVINARNYHKELKQIVYGDDFVELLLQVEHIESTKRAKARRNYSRSIQDLNERILNLITNVYTATGGTKRYDKGNLSDANKKELLKIVTRNRNNKSIESFLNTFWSKDLYIVDPSGVLFLEYDTSKDIPPYLTYKSIDRIRNYAFNGQILEWIIFEPKIIREPKKVLGFSTGTEKEIKLIRFVDDVKDYTFKVEGENYTLIEELTFDHPFGKVPGLINSDLQRLGTLKRFSLIDNIIPIEKEYMSDQSRLTLFKVLKGNPTPIRPGVICPTCHGTKKVGTKQCTDCDGKGLVLRNDITDEILIPISLDREEGYNLPTGIFTYMTPPTDIWDTYNTELIKLQNTIEDTLWGTHKERFENDRTAFETFIDTQPVTTKLSSISEVAEFMEFFFTELIANFVDPAKPKNENVSLISYGKTFIIEPAEAVMERYRTNKEKGVSVVVLDRQLTEYLTAKYKNNPTELFNELVKKELDYYVHFTVEQVQSIFDDKEAQKQILFTDWWETLDEKDIHKDIETLKKDRDTWINKQINELNIKTKNNE